jgi:hypothetical protein
MSAKLCSRQHWCPFYPLLVLIHSCARSRVDLATLGKISLEMSGIYFGNFEPSRSPSTARRIQRQ